LKFLQRACHSWDRNFKFTTLADWLCLAAAPSFAIMALLTGVLGGGPPDMLCSATQDASPLSGMLPMYLLMSAFHSAPWLKLISARRSAAAGPDPAFAGSGGAEAASGPMRLPWSS
jgi:hypothetical protein